MLQFIFPAPILTTSALSGQLIDVNFMFKFYNMYFCVASIVCGEILLGAKAQLVEELLLFYV